MFTHSRNYGKTSCEAIGVRETTDPKWGLGSIMIAVPDKGAMSAPDEDFHILPAFGE